MITKPHSGNNLRPLLLGGTALLGGLLMSGAPAWAFNVYSNGGGTEISLDTTAEWSAIYRVNHPSAILTNNINGNDGDLNFRHGIVDNTFDLLPVLDIKDGNYGAHVSGEFYLDTPYLGTTQNNSPATYNPYSTPSNKDFTSATRNINGQNAVLLDAFVYGSTSFGRGDQQTLTVKLGRQTLLWGQSLFFATNGISAGQAPIDVIKAESLPNAQAQQIFLPVGQAVVTYQPDMTYTIQGFYQFEWQPDTFQGVGAYFSSADILDKGGQRLIAGNNYLYRTKDIRPPIDNGQFGLSVQATYGNYDVGLYAERFDAKAPSLYLTGVQPGQPANSVGSYYLVYPRDIQLFGAALSTTVGPVNVAGEISGRRNMPLVSGAAFTATPVGPANGGALYAKGSTMAAQASFIYVSPGLPLDPGGMTIDGEVAMNHVLSVDSGAAELTPHRDATGAAFDIVFSPTYYEVLPNLTLTFPIGFKYNFLGRSQIDATMNHGTGTINFGVTGTYRSVWTAGITYQEYLGRPDPSLNPLADRGYVAFNIQRTF